MKKSIVMMLFLMLGIVVFTGCGSKMDKTAEEFKTEMMKNSAYGSEYSEDGFSFLIYKDKDTNRYLSETLVPVKDKTSALKYYFFFDENKKIDKSESETAFNEKKSSGNYEVIYKSGKFK
ncbi:hypothetical protein AAFA98_002775 [Enterococcus faecalis]